MSLDKIVEQVKSKMIDESNGKDFFQSKGLIDRLSSLTSLEALSVRQALGRLMKAGWLQGVSPDGFPLGRVKIVGEIPTRIADPMLLAWEDSMANEGIDSKNIVILSPCYKKLHGLLSQDLSFIARGLIRLKEEQFLHKGQPTFLVSAKYFLGSSKLLEELPRRNLMAFGIDLSQFSPPPAYVVVAGCKDPKTVVLIENPASFELAIATKAIESCAFISTFGFGLSNGNSEHGNQLATIVESGFAKAVTLTRQGSDSMTAQSLLSHKNITFWGDLDTAGIQIYLRLKSKIPSLKLSALYKPMLEALKLPDCSHPYVDITKKNGQIDMKASCNETQINTLLNLVKNRGVDQECVSPELIQSLAIEAL